MRKLSLVLLVLGSQAFALSLSIQDFTVSRSGGGQLEALVSATESGAITVRTLSCQFKKLTPEQQATTLVTLTGADAARASTVLANKAVLAANQSIHHPNAVGGTWVSLKVDYSYETPATGEMKNDTRNIAAPIVIIDGVATDLVRRIEDAARAASKPVCTPN